MSECGQDAVDGGGLEGFPGMRRGIGSEGLLEGLGDGGGPSVEVVVAELLVEEVQEFFEVLLLRPLGLWGSPLNVEHGVELGPGQKRLGVIGLEFLRSRNLILRKKFVFGDIGVVVVHSVEARLSSGNGHFVIDNIHYLDHFHCNHKIKST